MQKRHFYLWLAAASLYIGLGMILGYIFSDRAKTLPAYVGGALVFLGAILLGMVISSRSARVNNDTDEQHENTTGSGEIADHNNIAEE